MRYGTRGIQKQIGVPFYIPVKDGVTHREVQHMVWHRVKFIAWSVEFWENRKAEVAKGVVKSEYPFELAAQPTTVKKGDRLNVWWENDNAVYGGVVQNCTYEKSGELSQVELRYDDGDVKLYGGDSDFDLNNLLERVHQANCLTAMSPYNIVVGCKEGGINQSFAYRNKADYIAKKIRPRQDLTSSFAYDDEPMYLAPEHHLIVNWFKELNSKNVSDGRYSDNKIKMANRYPGARRPACGENSSTWTLLNLDPAFPRRVQLSGLDKGLEDLNGIFTLEDKHYHGYPRYKFERQFKHKSIYLFRFQEMLWYVGVDTQTIYMKSSSDKHAFPTQVKWTVWIQGTGWATRNRKVRFTDPDKSSNSALKKRADSAVEDDDDLPSLKQCFKIHSEATKMDKMNTWFCNKCKEHVQGTQKLDVWIAPEVLIIVLKRFRVEKGRWSFYHKRKISSLITFPIDGLDISPFVKGNDGSQKMIYDCFGICNHSGSTAGGHYTAYVRELPGDLWIHCDDTRISKVSKETLVTPKAYVMFYQRRKSSK